MKHSIGLGLLLLPIIILISITTTPISGGEVLVLCVLSSPSHKNVFEPVVSGLAKKGHQVTVVSAWKPKKERANVTELVVLPGFDYFPERSTMDIRREGIRGMLSMSTEHINRACHQIYENPEFQELMYKRKFDAVLVDMLGNECLYGAVHVMGSPLVLVSTFPAPGFFTSFLGTRLPPSFVPAGMMPYGDSMTFFQRVLNLLVLPLFPMVVGRQRPILEGIYREHLGETVPGVEEILGSASLMLVNSHFTLNHPRPTMPDIVEFGGAHCGPGKPLPKDIEDFVSGSEDGFIFFSLGSIVKPHEIDDSIRQVFVNVFRKLPYRVLWKWGEDTMPDLPENVKLLKWAPQQDILAHPKIKLFMTHGGLLSLQEAVYHGVPVIVVPIFADQDNNAAKAVQLGIGDKIEILDVDEAELEATITSVTSPQYKERIQNISLVFRDRNHNPGDDAVYWTEYIMRHKGAPHLRSAARDLNFFQYHSLDVMAFLTVLAAILLWLLKVAIWKLIAVLKNLVSSNKHKRE